MADLARFWAIGQDWRPPFAARLRQFSAISLLAFPGATLFAPIPGWARIALSISMVVLAYLILSFGLYRLLVATSSYKATDVDAKDLGWFGDTVEEIVEVIGAQEVFIRATSPGHGDDVVAGGTLVCRFPCLDHDVVLVVTCQSESPTDDIDIRFVSDIGGVLLSTGNVPALVPLSGVMQVFDQKADKRTLFEHHCARVIDGRPLSASEAARRMVSTDAEPNPIRVAGFWRFVRSWAVNAWRSSGEVLPLT